MKVKINIFSDRQKPRKFITGRHAIQEILKEFRQKENDRRCKFQYVRRNDEYQKILETRQLCLLSSTLFSIVTKLSQRQEARKRNGGIKIGRKKTLYSQITCLYKDNPKNRQTSKTTKFSKFKDSGQYTQNKYIFKYYMKQQMGNF
jgi:hypothetical protein